MHPVFAAKLAKMHGYEQSKRCGIPIRSRWVAVGALCLLLITACGQKGDLYLPDDSRIEQPQTE